jgi:hypothetical protein
MRQLGQFFNILQMTRKRSGSTKNSTRIKKRKQMPTFRVSASVEIAETVDITKIQALKLPTQSQLRPQKKGTPEKKKKERNLTA